MTEEGKVEARGHLAGVGWRSVAVAAAAAVTGIVALAALSDPTPPGARYAVGESQDRSSTTVDDPLREELARCRTMPANSDDAGCRAAWEVNRRLFMGESRGFVPAAEPVAMPAPEPITPSSITQVGER
jgi:conjugative transfer region protein TrbK